MKITWRKRFRDNGRFLGFGPAHTIYIGHKHTLLEVDREGNRIAKKTIPEKSWKRACSASRLWCRLMRYEIRAFGRLGDRRGRSGYPR